MLPTYEEHMQGSCTSLAEPRGSNYQLARPTNPKPPPQPQNGYHQNNYQNISKSKTSLHNYEHDYYR